MDRRLKSLDLALIQDSIEMDPTNLINYMSQITNVLQQSCLDNPQNNLRVWSVLHPLLKQLEDLHAPALAFERPESPKCPQKPVSERSSSNYLERIGCFLSEKKHSGAHNYFDLPEKRCEFPEKRIAYEQLIINAIQSTEKKRITLNDIYKYAMDNYSYFNSSDDKWKNSVRHQLSMNPIFVRVARPINERGRGSYWTLCYCENSEIVQEDAVIPKFINEIAKTNFHKEAISQSRMPRNISAEQLAQIHETDQFNEEAMNPKVMKGIPNEHHIAEAIQSNSDNRLSFTDICAYVIDRYGHLKPNSFNWKVK